MRDCCSLEETALYWEAEGSPLAVPKGAGVFFFCLVAWFFSYFLLEKRAAEDEMVR